MEKSVGPPCFNRNCKISDYFKLSFYDSIQGRRETAYEEKRE